MSSNTEQTDLILEKILTLVNNLNQISNPELLDKLATENETYKEISKIVSERFIPREEVDKKIDEFNEILLAYALHSYSDQLEITNNDNDLFNSLATSINILGEELNYSTVARDYIEDIFNSIEDILIVVDNNGNISFINSSTTRILKFTKNEILKRNFEILLDGQTTFDKLVDIAFDKLDVYLLNKSSLKVPVSLRVSPFVQGDNMQTGYIIIATDITQQIKYQKEIEKANEELKVALFKAEESDKLKTAFLQNMSHEIRTPLNGIVGFTQLLASDDLTEESRAEIVRVVEKSSNRLIEIVNNILDIAKIETGQIKVTSSIFNLNDLISDTYEFFVLFAKDKNLELNFSNHLHNDDAMIYTDREKIHQVLVNLINNAIKFTTKGEVNFGYCIKDDYLEFFVKDTGIGIPSDFCEKVFDRFIQVDSAITRNYEGAGLGLSISKGLVEVLGGKMWVESEVNKGASFFFTIPYKPVEQKTNPVKGRTLTWKQLHAH